ncbi:MAG: dTDP-glucose 4,6-dehydratase [Chlamydiota bacterium]
MQPIRSLANILVTGGAGFIGSGFIRWLLRSHLFKGKIINLDALTYAASLDSLNGFLEHPRYRFFQGDILNQSLVEKIIEECEIDAIVHFAAETHVDRSIASALPFFETNVKGTLTLLEAVRKTPEIHFHHISTDEVYGSLGESGSFSEMSSYRPNSPYAASKAASDHLVRAFANTYGLSTTLSHCSNNYGPCQYPEKFIPLMIRNCLAKKILPVYGHGANVRDWLYVDDHAEAIWMILQYGKKGQTFDIGGKSEYTNLDLLHLVIERVAFETKTDPEMYRSRISFVADRPGHDFRYAIDSSKIERELNWRARTDFKKGLERTVRWYTTRGSK